MRFYRKENLKLFKPIDILIYALLIIGVFSLFLFFVILPANSSNNGFTVTINGKTIFNYHYGAYTVDLVDYEMADHIVYDKQASTITVYVDDDKQDFNVIKIDEANKTAKVIDANCSISKDCVYTPSIKNGSAIVCAPHKLKIVALGDKAIRPPTTGGVL